jgi:hypothetical protein
MFKPLVTDDDIAAADEDIKVAVEAASFASTRESGERRGESLTASEPVEIDAPETGRVIDGEPEWCREFPGLELEIDADLGDIDVKPEVRIDMVRPSRMARVAALMGFSGAMRRADTANKIARIVDFALSQGIEETQRIVGKDVIGALRSLAANARDPKTTQRELDRLLGWAQAAVCLSCPGVTMATAEAI